MSKDISKIDQVLQFNMREMSLDEKIGKDRETPISDYLVDRDRSSPEDDLISREANTLVGEAIHFLSNQEKRVITLRFGLSGGTPLTLKEIGARMDISRERVRQVECQVKSRLRKMFARKRKEKSPAKRPRAAGRIATRIRTDHCGASRRT